MKNSFFNVQINPKTGCITSLVHPFDKDRMNWCSDLDEWGKLYTTLEKQPSNYRHECWKNDTEFTLTKLEQRENEMTAVYNNNRYAVTVKRFFSQSDRLTERYTIKNITDVIVCINRDNFGICLPFHDIYTYADDCMRHCCNTHIWCGLNCSWVDALRMGNSDINLGLVLTKGSLISYSQIHCKSNMRGSFILEPETVLLKSGEEYVLEWELFWHSGKNEFEKKIAEYSSYIGIKAKHFTVFEGESIEFEIISSKGDFPVVTLDEKEIEVTENNGRYFVSYMPRNNGELNFEIKCANIRTYASFMVKIPFKELLRKRLHFIADKQQCKDKSSPLYGAYLIYDRKTKSTYFDFFNTDHNACRERLNMPLAIIRYLQLAQDEKMRRSIDLFIDFLFREFYEETTGEVFNNIGKRQDALRLYNAPGVMLLFAEMYQLTKEEKYLEQILLLAEKYYSIGGEKCYSNAVAIRKVVSAFENAERFDDKEKILELFHMHTDNMIKNDIYYPPHEVNYEQTIVTPAVICLSEMGLYDDNKEYFAAQAKKHLQILDRFSGHQPSHYLNEIAIRHWDDYWFGKSHLIGDTLPHHLSCLTARAFVAYARLTKSKEYIYRAEECMRNGLCLIGDDAMGCAAHVYPHSVNGCVGEFYDDWANDQDLLLYDALNCCDLIETFRI